MQKSHIIKGLVFSGLLCGVVAGCATVPDGNTIAKYTNQEALAIIDAGWKIGGSIVIAAIIRAIFNE